MIDTHFHPLNWGIKPTLFFIGNFGIPSYAFFVSLGLFVGILVYIYESKRQKVFSENGFLIAFGALTGGTIGAKVLSFLISYQFIISHFSLLSLFFSGRTIVGGLIGGSIGAVITKKLLGIKEKRGNLFAPAIAIGVSIGRFGCFFQGCCYGRETSLPWGVNFGDGILRHPTQLYESLFMLLMFIYLEKLNRDDKSNPGQLFKLLMVSYFSFRFFIEFIRVELIFSIGLSVFQVISIAVVVYLMKDDIIKMMIMFFYERRKSIR